MIIKMKYKHLISLIVILIFAVYTDLRLVRLEHTVKNLQKQTAENFIGHENFIGDNGKALLDLSDVVNGGSNRTINVKAFDAYFKTNVSNFKLILK